MEGRLMDKTPQTLELRDIHLPADPSMWPLAIGWWLLIILGCVIAYFVYKKLLEIKKIKQTNLLLQNELQAINNAYKQHADKHKLASEVSELLNRFVRHVLKDSHATTLTGEKWIAYLNSRTNSNEFNPYLKELTQAQYIKNIEFDVPSLLATVKNYFPQALKNIKSFNKGNRSNNHA